MSPRSLPASCLIWGSLASKLAHGRYEPCHFKSTNAPKMGNKNVRFFKDRNPCNIFVDAGSTSPVACIWGEKSNLDFHSDLLVKFFFFQTFSHQMSSELFTLKICFFLFRTDLWWTISWSDEINVRRCHITIFFTKKKHGIRHGFQ